MLVVNYILKTHTPATTASVENYTLYKYSQIYKIIIIIMKAKQMFRSLLRRHGSGGKDEKERRSDSSTSEVLYTEEMMFTQCDRYCRRGVVISQSADQMQSTIIDPNTVISSVFRIYLYGTFR